LLVVVSLLCELSSLMAFVKGSLVSVKRTAAGNVPLRRHDVSVQLHKLR